MANLHRRDMHALCQITISHFDDPIQGLDEDALLRWCRRNRRSNEVARTILQGYADHEAALRRAG